MMMSRKQALFGWASALVLALAVAAAWPARTAHAQDIYAMADVENALFRTDRVISSADVVVNPSDSDRAEDLLEDAQKLQNRAKARFHMAQQGRIEDRDMAIRATLQARALAQEAMRVAQGPLRTDERVAYYESDYPYYSDTRYSEYRTSYGSSHADALAAIQRTDRMIDLVDQDIRSSHMRNARVSLSEATRLQSRARTNWRRGSNRQALALTMRARNHVNRATRIARVSTPAYRNGYRYSTYPNGYYRNGARSAYAMRTETAIQRTDRMVYAARTELGDNSVARRELMTGMHLQERARLAWAAGDEDEAFRLTVMAREHLHMAEQLMD